MDCSAVCSQPAYCTAVYESDDTRCCNNTTVPPDDEHVNVRNMSRTIM